MIVLLTGYKGFVGSHLIKKLESLGHELIYIGRNDILDGHPDAIINCAAELTTEDEMFGSNVVFLEKLLRFASERGVKKFIQIGSSSEYGVTNQPRREDALCVPSNIYEATKLAATSLCLGYSALYDIDICIARPFSLYGPNDKPRKIIPTLCRAYLENKTINLYEGSHDWIYIDDFVDGLIILLEADSSSTKGDIINFGTGISSSNQKLLTYLELALGGSISTENKKGKYHTHDVDHWVADIDKATLKYKWKPKYNLAEGLKELVATERIKNK